MTTVPKTNITNYIITVFKFQEKGWYPWKWEVRKNYQLLNSGHARNEDKAVKTATKFVESQKTAIQKERDLRERTRREIIIDG